MCIRDSSLSTYPLACFSLVYVAFAHYGVFLTNLGQVSRPFLTSSAKLKGCSRWPKNDSMLKCRIRSKPIGKLTFLDTCWRPNLVQFGAGNSHLNWFCLGSILAEATPSIFSKLWCFCRKFKYNGDVWNTLFISSGSFSKIRPGGTKPMFGAQQITAKPVVLDRKRHQVRICGLLTKNSRYLAFPTKKYWKHRGLCCPAVSKNWNEQRYADAKCWVSTAYGGKVSFRLA